MKKKDCMEKKLSKCEFTGNVGESELAKIMKQDKEETTWLHGKRPNLKDDTVWLAEVGCTGTSISTAGGWRPETQQLPPTRQNTEEEGT